MVGPQYDLLVNPLGAVRQTFDKAVESSQPYDLDPTAAFRGKDWGAVQLFREFIFDQGGLSKVPILDSSSMMWIQPNSLVRFRGMVQDMLGNELYIGAFKDGTTWRTNKFTDFSQFPMPPVAETTLWERYLFHCVPVPGQNSWTIESTPYPNIQKISNFSAFQHGEKRRRDGDTNGTDVSFCEKECSPSCSKKPKEDGNLSFASSLSQVLEKNNDLPNFPPSSFSCLVKVYDMPENQLKLNEVVEFIGIYTFDPELNVNTNNKDDMDDDMMYDFMDDVASHLPPSKVPRLHCLVSRKLSTQDFVSFSHPIETLPNVMRGIRDSLFAYLTCILGNDGLAAQCLLLHLLSKVRARADVTIVGRLILNFIGFTHETASIFGNRINSAIQSLLPFSQSLPLTVEYLNSATLQPKKDNQTGRLMMGALQLASGTHLTYDETCMQSGTLNSGGVENVSLLKHLLESQTVEYDFEYYKLEMATEVQVLVLSEGKSSILPADLILPFRPSAVSPVSASQDDLQCWRWYLATLKSFPQSTDPRIYETLQEEMVNAMREDRSLGCAELSRWLTMAQLMATSFGESGLSLEHWKMVKEMEKLRKERLK